MLKKIQDILLLLLLFSVNFEVWDPLNTNGSFSISKLAGIFYLLSVIPTWKMFFSLKNNILRHIDKLIAFFILLTIMNLVNMNYFSSTIIYTTFLQWLIMMIIIVNHCINRPYVIDKLLLFFSLGSFLMAILYQFGIGVEITSEGRVSLFDDNENAIGIRMSIAAFYLVYLSLKNTLNQSILVRIFYLLMIVPIIALLIDTASRTAIIALVGMLIVLSLLIKSTKRYLRPVLFLSILLLLIIVVIQVLNNEVLLYRLILSSEEGSLGGRDEIWRKLIPVILENPILGIGQTGYAKFWALNSIQGAIKSPHNVIIEILCYTGIVGFLLYFSFYFSQVIQAFSFRKYNNDIYLFIIFIPITGLMISGQALGIKYVWAIYAIVLAKYIIYNKKGLLSH